MAAPDRLARRQSQGRQTYHAGLDGLASDYAGGYRGVYLANDVHARKVAKVCVHSTSAPAFATLALLADTWGQAWRAWPRFLARTYDLEHCVDDFRGMAGD